MVPTAGDESLRVLATSSSRPLPAQGLRVQPGDGAAGTAYSEARFECRRGIVPVFAEEIDRPRHRIAASTPIVGWGRVIGVLSANIDTTEEVPDERIRQELERGAGDAARLMLGAIDFRRIASDVHAHLVPRIVDLLLSMDESLPLRIAGVTEVLHRALDSERGRFYVVDRLRNRVHPVDQATDGGILNLDSLPVDRGILRQILRAREPQLLEFVPADHDVPIGLLCQPVHVVHPFGLITLEGVPLAGERREHALRLLRETIEQVEEVIQIEDQVAAQDLTHELEMRIADQASRVAGLPVPIGLQVALSLAIDLMAAEIALWVPSTSGRPVSTPPESPQAARILATAWENLDPLLEHTRRETLAEGLLPLDASVPGTPPVRVPYLGVLESKGRGTLFVFFPPEEIAGVLAQVSSDVLSRALHRLAELIPGGD